MGSIVKGKVYNITDFGAFVELEPGIDGLLHVSNIMDEAVKHPSEVLRKGQRVDKMVLEIDSDNKRIALGMKQIEGGQEVTEEDEGSDSQEL